MERRGFVTTLLAAGAGAAALMRSIKARAKGLPSDSGGASATGGEGRIALPGFEKDSGYTLEQALLDRRSERSFDENKKLDHEQLAKILWAANGVNRADGHRTTPSAVASYPVDVLIALPEGVYKYDLKNHALERVIDKDIRSLVPIQPGFKKAAGIVLYIVNEGMLTGGDNQWADLEIGCMVQDVYLMAAQLGLGSCVFAIVQYDRVTRELGLKNRRVLRIAQAVGPLAS